MPGFPDVTKNCMLQSFHQSSKQFEVLFHKTTYDALPGIETITHGHLGCDRDITRTLDLMVMGIQILAISLLYMWPQIGMWLPRLLYR